MSSPLLRPALPLVLVLLLAVTLVALPSERLPLEAHASDRAAAFTRVLDGLPDAPLVVVGMDPDLGTYAEIRPTIRAVLADLLGRGASLAFVSLSAEGRMLAVDERARLDAGPVVDLGFRPGAEAALVELARNPILPFTGGAMPTRGVASRLVAGLGGADLVVVVGGNEIGPRSWVEQVHTRVPELPIAAVAPTVLLPELTPYLESGGLAALLGTRDDGLAYRASLGADVTGDPGTTGGPGSAPFLLGIVVALGALVGALAGRIRTVARGLTREG